jgi:plastocyanin
LSRRFACSFSLLIAALAANPHSRAQDPPLPNPSAELHFRVASSLPGNHRAVPAVAWLTPLAGTQVASFTPQGRYTLLQKNRTFTPHLQVIPVGAAVQFPNADPFYHNVFSLFEGKRFDLGLYEAGSSKSVTFSREGVSYIFCNIHPEMSAVVLALSTPLYAEADSSDSFVLHGIAPGEYKLHLWIEGVPQSSLDALGRTLHVGGSNLDLGTITAPIAQPRAMTHMNKFGDPYDPKSQSTY